MIYYFKRGFLMLINKIQYSPVTAKFNQKKIIQNTTFKGNLENNNSTSKFVRDTETNLVALREYIEHPDLKDTSGKANKVIEDLMDKTVMKVNISCIDSIDTLELIKRKHPHLKELASECIDLLQYYNSCKTW